MGDGAVTGALEARVAVQVGDLDIDLAFTAEARETVVIVGPNGAGKSTLLHALAGLRPLVAGRVALRGRVLEDTETGLRVPPEDRGFGVVFQGLSLFPHLRAVDNVAFGLRARGLRRSAARSEAVAVLGRLRLLDRAEARPAQLSGGEAQRVALARALAPGPDALLLDEPFAALDASTRAHTRAELARDLDTFEGPRVVVTHDPLDAAALGSRVLVLERGRIIQSGSVAELAARPRSSWVADLVGTNLYRGRIDHGELILGGDGRPVARIATDLEGEAFATFHPRTVALHRARPEGSARNVWALSVEELQPIGDRVRVRAGGQIAVVAEVTPAAVSELGIERGSRVWASVKATEIDAYPA